jgi:hypothetical protein
MRALWKYSNRRLKVIYFSWTRWSADARWGFWEQCFPPDEEI